MYGLDSLITPHEREAYLSAFWGRHAVLIPGEPDRFQGLFGWDDINHVLTHGRRHAPSLRLVMDKTTLPPQALEQVDQWLTRGATLVINQVQEIDAIVDRFASALASDLNVRVGVNCYASWPSRQGFDIHYDLHDVFVLHLEGRKSWKVFEPTRRWPVEQEKGQVTLTPPAGAVPYLECSLIAGVRALGGDRPDTELDAHWGEPVARLPPSWPTLRCSRGSSARA